MFRQFLGLDKHPETAQAAQSAPAAEPAPGSAAETATVRRIVARLEAMPPDEARYLACFGYVMSRAAYADLDISDEETAVMEKLLQEGGHLDESQAILVVEMAKLQARAQGDTEDYVVTREFKSISTMDQRRSLLRACFAVEAIDGTITAEEASIVNEIARELDIERDELNAIRDEYHEQLSSVQALRKASGGASA
jgi:uncharacterized tellurite resistance protein B-like protein